MRVVIGVLFLTMSAGAVWAQIPRRSYRPAPIPPRYHPSTYGRPVSRPNYLFPSHLPPAYAPFLTNNYGPYPHAPCGPDWLAPPLRHLIPQGYLGADFRPACQAHDACYTWPGWTRADCDRIYYHQLMYACNNSACPRTCRMKASAMFNSVRLFGNQDYWNSRLWQMAPQPGW